jgi:hypothetical protein
MSLKYYALASVAVCASLGLAFYLHKHRLSPDYLTIKVLSPDSYIAITKAMREFYSKNYWKELAQFRSQRRELNPRSAEYQKIADNFQSLVKNLVIKAQERILREFGISTEDFERSVNFYDSDPELKQYGCDLVNPYSKNNSEIRLSKGKTKEILVFYSERMKEFESDCPDLDEYMLNNMEIEDEVFRRFGVDIEDVNAAWEVHKKDMEEIVDPLKNQTHYVLASSSDSI